MGNVSKQERKGKLHLETKRVCFLAGMAKELTAKSRKDLPLIEISLLTQTDF